MADPYAVAPARRGLPRTGTALDLAQTRLGVVNYLLLADEPINGCCICQTADQLTTARERAHFIRAVVRRQIDGW